MTEFLGIDHVPFNYRLREARLRLGWNRRRLALESGLSPSQIGNYEALQAWPSQRIQSRIADALRDDAGYLFPPDVGVALKGRRASTTTSVLSFDTIALADPQALRLAAPDLIGAVEDRDMAVIVGGLVDGLPSRERRVVREHLGFDGQEPRAFVAIAADLELSPVRVAQIYQKALRRLRQPVNSKRLRVVT